MAKRRMTPVSLGDELEEGRRILKIKILAETGNRKLCQIVEQSHRGGDFWFRYNEENQEVPEVTFVAKNGFRLISGDRGPFMYPSYRALIVRAPEQYGSTDDNPFSVDEPQFYELIQAIQEYNRAKAPGDVLSFAERLQL